MTFSITWEGIAAIVALTAAVCAYCSWFVKITVRDVLRREFQSLVEKFVPSAGGKATGAEIERRLNAVEQNLWEIVADRLKHSEAD